MSHPSKGEGVRASAQMPAWWLVNFFCIPCTRLLCSLQSWQFSCLEMGMFKHFRPQAHFYHVMHYSAKCGIAIACRPSICPSVTLVDQDHIGWKSWKLIARTISPTTSLFVAHRPSTYSQGNMGKVSRYIHRVHLNKSPLNIMEKGEHGRIQGLTKFFDYPPIISGTGKSTNFKFCAHIHRIDWNKSLLKLSGKVAVHTQGLSKISSAPIGRIMWSSLWLLSFLVRSGTDPILLLILLLLLGWRC